MMGKRLERIKQMQDCLQNINLNHKMLLEIANEETDVELRVLLLNYLLYSSIFNMSLYKCLVKSISKQGRKDIDDIEFKKLIQQLKDSNGQNGK